MRLARAMGPRPQELIDWPVGSQGFARLPELRLRALPGLPLKLTEQASPVRQEARQQLPPARRKGQALALEPAGLQRLDWPAATGPAPSPIRSAFWSRPRRRRPAPRRPGWQHGYYSFDGLRGVSGGINLSDGEAETGYHEPLGTGMRWKLGNREACFRQDRCSGQVARHSPYRLGS